MSLTVSIITPLGVTYEGEATSVIVPTESGVVTILDNHMPIISVIKSGECVVVRDDNSRTPFAIWKGVLEVKGEAGNTQAMLLVDRSEHALDIDVSRAEEALKRAEEIRDGVAGEDVDFARFEALIDKELNRVRVGKKYR